RRKEKKKAIARQHSGGLPAQLSQAARYPILHCWMTDSNEKIGKGYVVISRALPDGNVAFASFLIDRWCLGVKDLLVAVVHHASYEERIYRQGRAQQPSRDVPPEDACKYVLGAVEYARELGLPPHEDYPRAMLLFTGVDPSRSTATFEYGHDGKPHFMAGPNDGPARCRQIIAILHHHCGQGNYHFTIPFADPSMLPEGADFERLGWNEADEDE